MTREEYKSECMGLWKAYNGFMDDYRAKRDAFYIEIGRMFFKIKTEKRCKTFFDKQKEAFDGMSRLKSERERIYHETIYKLNRLKLKYEKEHDGTPIGFVRNSEV